MRKKISSFITSLDAAYVPTPYLSFRVGGWEVRIRSPIALGWEGVKLCVEVAFGVQLWARLVVGALWVFVREVGWVVVMVGLLKGMWEGRAVF